MSIANENISDKFSKIILDKIKSGKYKTNERIQSERELSLKYGISRCTVHKVLSNLVATGILHRKHGCGTYVSPVKINKSRKLSICVLGPSIDCDALASLIGQFKSKYPDTIVKTTFYPWSEVGNPVFWDNENDFDVILVEEFMTSFLVGKNILEDISGFVRNILSTEIFHEKPFSCYERDGSYYAIPTVFSPVVLFCNNKLLNAADLQLPVADWNIDEFLYMAQKLSCHNKNQLGFVFSTHRNRWPVLFKSVGGSFLDSKETFKINTPDNCSVLKFLLNFIHHKRISPIPFLASEQLFNNGKTGMILASAYNFPDIMNKNEVSACPIFRERGRPTGLLSSGFGISRNSDNKDFALSFLSFSMGEYFQKTLYKTQRALPIRKSKDLENFPFYQMFINELEHSEVILKTPFYHRIITAFEKYMPQLWAQIKPVEEILQEIDVAVKTHRSVLDFA